jgi:agmatine deiminase
MIADWETNHLFVSDRLENEFPALFANLRSLNNLTIGMIPATKDIWCRDYMPIQLDENRFCQFVYAPDYLRGFEHRITPPQQCRMPFMKDCQQEPIVLDGGNVVASQAKVILTDKVYTENPTIERPVLRERLEQVFQAKCIFIPKQVGDDVGHSDGVVRFVSRNRVLLNDYSTIDPAYGAKVRNVLEKHGLEVETLPMFEEDGGQRCGDLPTAVGIYINYLQVGDVLVVPGYDRPEDEAVLKKLKRVMPHSPVFQVPCRSLAEKGGVLNCISWTINR